MSGPSLSPAYFENVYAASDDPWDFATSPYERLKYEATLSALPAPTYGRALEIGCSIGVLTDRLARRCDTLLSVDVNERALEAARARNQHHDNVAFANMVVPRDFPPGHFDLVVISEVAYYWSDQDLARAIDLVSKTSGTTVELVHFLPKVADYPRDGDSAHAAFLNDPRFESIFASRAEAYRIDVLRVR